MSNNKSSNTKKSSTTIKKSDTKKSSTVKETSAKNSSVNKNIKTTKQSIKEENTLDQELIAEEASNTFLRIIVAIILIAIIIVLAVKAFKKDEKEKNNKDKKVTTTTKYVDVKTTIRTTSYVYYEKAEPTSDTNNEKENIIISTPIIEEENEEIKDTTSPVITGVENNKAYSSVFITAIDDTTLPEDLVALIDDEEYNLGEEYNKNGKHRLKVTDKAGNEAEIDFIIAKFVSDEAEYYKAMEEENIEYIGFENDIQIIDDSMVLASYVDGSTNFNGYLSVFRNVKFVSKEDVILTFGFNIESDVEANLENVILKYQNGKKINLYGSLKILSSSIEFDSYSFILCEDESSLEIIDSNINLLEEHQTKSSAILVNTGVKKTNIKIENSNVELNTDYLKSSDITSLIVYDDENDEASLSINNTIISNNDEENSSIAIEVKNNNNSKIEITSTEINGFNTSIDLDSDSEDCVVDVEDSILSGEEPIKADEENNEINIKIGEEI